MRKIEGEGSGESIERSDLFWGEGEGSFLEGKLKELVISRKN